MILRFAIPLLSAAIGLGVTFVIVTTWFQAKAECAGYGWDSGYLKVLTPMCSKTEQEVTISVPLRMLRDGWEYDTIKVYATEPKGRER